MDGVHRYARRQFAEFAGEKSRSQVLGHARQPSLVFREGDLEEDCPKVTRATGQLPDCVRRPGVRDERECRRRVRDQIAEGWHHMIDRHRSDA